MNSIIGFSELAADDALPKKTRDYLAKITENSQLLLQIINDILDISKIEAGRMELENVPFDLHEIFVNCQTMMMARAKEKNLLLHFYAEPSIGKRLLGDPTKLRQVFLNLLSNAVKFTNVGAVKMSADVLESDDTSVTIQFEIKDSGIGMTQEQITRIFEPFMQADSGITRKFGGTGLGLAITKNIIELMGGSLFVESTPGVGSKFSFGLRFGTIEIPVAGEAGSSPSEKYDKPVFGGEVLLCEDNFMNQQVICDHLERVGLKTVVAENGSIGLDIIQSRLKYNEKMFDLIFMDIHMPVMDGIEASSKIIALGVKIPIIALTANVMTNETELYRKHGMRDCMPKPFTSQELWRCLLKYLKPVERADGAARAENDGGLQKKLIMNFIETNRDAASDITAALETGDVARAHRRAHSLKGNAGLIGKTGLQKASEAVESALKDGKNNLTGEILTNFFYELRAVMNELLPLVPAENNAGPREGGLSDTENLPALLKKLEPLLKEGNTDCLGYADKLSEIPGCEELAKQIAAFNFERARELLIEIADGLGSIK